MIAIVFGALAVFGFVEIYPVNADGIETNAKVIKGGPARGEAVIEFRTRDGSLVRTEIGGGEVGRTGETSRIRYAADDPTDVVGAGSDDVVVNYVVPFVFAFISVYGAVMTYRRLIQPRGFEPS